MFLDKFKVKELKYGQYILAKQLSLSRCLYYSVGSLKIPDKESWMIPISLRCTSFSSLSLDNKPKPLNAKPLIWRESMKKPCSVSRLQHSGWTRGRRGHQPYITVHYTQFFGFFFSRIGHTALVISSWTFFCSFSFSVIPKVVTQFIVLANIHELPEEKKSDVSLTNLKKLLHYIVYIHFCFGAVDLLKYDLCAEMISACL